MAIIRPGTSNAEAPDRAVNPDTASNSAVTTPAMVSKKTPVVRKSIGIAPSGTRGGIEACSLALRYQPPARPACQAWDLPPGQTAPAPPTAQPPPSTDSTPAGS